MIFLKKKTYKPDRPDYQWHPLGEAHELARPFGYNLGVAISYLYRAKYKADNGKLKGDRGALDDMEKAIVHIRFEIDSLKASDGT